MKKILLPALSIALLSACSDYDESPIIGQTYVCIANPDTITINFVDDSHYQYTSTGNRSNIWYTSRYVIDYPKVMLHQFGLSGYESTMGRFITPDTLQVSDYIFINNNLIH